MVLKLIRKLLGIGVVMSGVCLTPAIRVNFDEALRIGDGWFGFLDRHFGVGVVVTLLDLGLILIGARLIVPPSLRPRASSKGKKPAGFDEIC